MVGRTETWIVRRIDTPLVGLALAWDEAGRLVRIVLGGDLARIAAFAERHGARVRSGEGVVEHVERISRYLEGTPDPLDLPVRLFGTAFQQAAWRALGRIPYGHTWTYGRQAAEIGRPTAVRAVGAANAANPLPLVLPCHRVVAAGGRLGGFAAGTDLKARLLALEGVGRPSPG
ncbi:MAG: methylated-DNA--[protein]-cysteine S-methyltransferase [Deltaproteobacteria bacterium]|nr:MAG: methylated-DNA--[protein]-cysteine S-methyltransferase [Deltaproteobacteria bacterium]